jgi:hypothetical protein
MPRVNGLLALMFILSACSGAQPPTSSPTGSPTPTPTAQPSASPSPSPSPTPTPPSSGRIFTQADFTKSGGCGNVFMWAATEDETFAVTMQWNVGQPGEAREFDETVSLPDAEVQISLQTGTMLSQGFCTDILGMPGHRVDGDAPAVSGTVRLNLDPNDGGEPFSTSLADLTLDNILFDIVFGTETEQWRVEGLVLEDILVGWLAG